MKVSFLSRFVPAPRMLLLLAFILPLAAIVPITSAILVQLGFAALFAIALVDAWFGAVRKSGITVLMPELVRFSKNKGGSLSVRIQNSKQKKAVIRIGIPFPAELGAEVIEQMILLPDAEYSSCDWKCEPWRRGSYRIDRCYLENRSPLGIWLIRSVQAVSTEIRVYPNLMEERKKVASQFLNRDLSGIHSRKMVGQGREFEKLREYVPGDAYDQLHWKATARRGRPITKVYQIERTQEVYVMIDFSRRSAREVNGETTLEFFLRSALILGMIAQQQGDLFGLLPFSNRVQGFLRASSGKAHFHACRELLYRLQPQMVTPDFEDLFSFLRSRLRRRALFVFFTDLNDPMLSESFVRGVSLIAKQHLVLVNMIRPEAAIPLFQETDVSTEDAIYERLSGHMVWENLRDLRNVLHRYGIPFAQLPAPTLTVQVVNQYFAIKERQLL